MVYSQKNGKRTCARMSGAQADIGMREVEVHVILFLTNVVGRNAVP